MDILSVLARTIYLKIAYVRPIINIDLNNIYTEI